MRKPVRGDGHQEILVLSCGVGFRLRKRLVLTRATFTAPRPLHTPAFLPEFPPHLPGPSPEAPQSLVVTTLPDLQNCEPELYLFLSGEWVSSL